MHKASFLSYAISLAWFAGLPPVAVGAEKPNVVLVVTDDQGYGDLSCHGNPWLKTPQLDQLYVESTRLTNFHVCPTCAPTRAALLTGRYNKRTSIWHTIMGRSLLNEREETMAQVFQAAGYATGMFGKWHLGDNRGLLPSDRGFQQVVAHGGGGVGQTPDYWGNDYFDDTYMVNGAQKQFEGYCTDVWFREASRFIKQHRNKPFFLYLATNAPHSPYFVDPSYAEPFKENPDVVNAKFLGMVANIDENIGKLERTLADMQLRDNTIFIFMTDNGTAAGFDPRSGRGYNAGMRGKKGSYYDGGHRVPCFIRWPGNLPAGRDVPNLTAHIDLLPTLMQLCGISERNGLPLDGKSLAPLLRDELAEWPERVLVVDSQRVLKPQKYRQYAVMTDHWRLCGNGNQRELFDMRVDPSQTKDVSANHPQVVRQLIEEYERVWKSQQPDMALEQPIPIGRSVESDRLTAHDWRSEGAYKTFSHASIRQGPIAHGSWSIDVKSAGTYEFRLRRWPIELAAPINKDLPLRISQAQITIGEVTAQTEVNENAEEAVITMQLEPGQQMVDARFLSVDGESTGAFYVYIQRQ